MKGLTDTQKEVLGFLIERILQEGVAPSIVEIGKRFAFNSNRGVTVHLDALERKGYIERVPHTPRALRVLVDPSDRPIRLAFVPDPERKSVGTSS